MSQVPSNESIVAACEAVAVQPTCSRTPRRAAARRRGALLAPVAALLGMTGCTTSITAGGNPPQLERSAQALAPSADTLTTTSTIPSTTSTSTSTTTSTTTATTTATTTSTTIEAVTTTTELPWPRAITLAFTGDTLTHSPLWRQAARNAAPAEGFDFEPMLAELAPLIGSADLAVCHLETPIAPLGEEYTTNPYYGVPAEIVDAIADAGYDRCSTASNHAADRGTAGVDRTVDVLEDAGLGQSGMARTPLEIEPTVIDIDGVSVSHLSYTFSYNGLSFPDDEPWRSAVIDPERILADARQARSVGADVVVVSMHWGAEGVSAPTTSQRRIADEITADGLIDIVVGHHAHVLQPIERINDTWVLFGLGNILSNLPTTSRWPAGSQDGAIVLVDVEVEQNGSVEVSQPAAHATWVDHDAGWVVRLVDVELARTDISDGQRGRLERSRSRTERVLATFLAETAVR